MGCTKATTNNQDIRSSVTVKSLFAIISWTTRQICTIELVLESIYQKVSNDISYIIWRLVFIEIQVYQCNDIISYLLKLAWQLLSGMSFDHIMAKFCAWTITLLYIYIFVSED